MSQEPTAGSSSQTNSGSAGEGSAPASPAGSGALHLEVISGMAAGATIVVEEELIIGRHAEGAGKLADDAEISRQHARISREAGGSYGIEDLGSSNGTFVNGMMIGSPKLLAVGDSIEVGGTTLVVREIIAPAQDELPPTPAPNVASSGRTAVTPAYGHDSVAMPADAAAPPSTEALAPEDAPPPAATLALQLEIDFESRQARIALPGGGDAIDLVFEADGWHVKPASD